MADTNIQLATEGSAVITTQPSLNFTNTTGPNQVLDNIPSTAFLKNESDVITTQPLMNNTTDEEENQKKKFNQFNPSGNVPPQNVQQQPQANGDDCTWCCFVCTDCACDTAELCVDCADCCKDCCNDSGDCCTGCCDGGTGDVDGGDVAGCLECCGACVECCNDN